MKEKTGAQILREKLPVITVWYNLMLIYLLQFAFFITILYILWRITTAIWFTALIGQFAVAFIGVFPLMYITKNSVKIRKKFIKKYGDLAYQHLWFRFLSYNEPFSSASLYFPILLMNYDFLPSIISLPSNFMTRSLLPIYVSLPICIIFIILGILFRRPGGGFDIDVDSYVYLMFPKESKKIEGGLYQYVRHPRYLGRGLIVVGLGIFSNNLLGLSVSLIHFLPYYILSKIEDYELVKRFGTSFQRRCIEIPALIPKIKNWKKIIKYLFCKKSE
jgi:protein-S-isoprenylcysteine O-methyltransferase Ste14